MAFGPSLEVGKIDRLSIWVLFQRLLVLVDQSQIWSDDPSGAGENTKLFTRVQLDIVDCGKAI
jgi:hypothetical protein